MISDDLYKALVVCIAHAEAKEDGVNAMLGVMFALRNQTEKNFKGGWPESLQHNNHLLVYAVPDIRDPKVQQLMLLVDSVFDGTRKDITKGAIRWYHPLPGEQFATQYTQIGGLMFSNDEV